MKIKIAIKKDSTAYQIIEAAYAEKEAFKCFVQSGKVGNPKLIKSDKVASE